MDRSRARAQLAAELSLLTLSTGGIVAFVAGAGSALGRASWLSIAVAAVLLGIPGGYWYQTFPRGRRRVRLAAGCVLATSTLAVLFGAVTTHPSDAGVLGVLLLPALQVLVLWIAVELLDRRR